ncbi:PAS domain-containing protein [Zunongwangia sp.]|uniref:PAS domain-containing protein n=1 Tax=Zunongwangia sp. TaxID=1965325 RepID=UPI003AA84383
MISLDIILSNPKLKIKRESTTQKLHPLQSCDIHSCHTDELKKINRRQQEVKALQSLAKKHEWDVSIESILQNDYETLILTEKNQKICWANKAFTKMTGYPVSYALGKKPSFLQGEHTSAADKKLIRQNISKNKLFSGILLNYRKNKEAYLCKIDIFPLKNKSGNIAHFLALEKEVYEPRRKN